MFRKLEDFFEAYKHNRESVIKAFGKLTDSSLKQEVAPGHRNLGTIAWHMACTIPEMGSRVGLELEGLPEAEVPTCAQAICDAYAKASDGLINALGKQWDDSILEIEDDMYGQQWKRGLTLAILLQHEAHHMGQVSVLMRQAGLMVPGVCGPSKEEWAAMGMEPMP